MPTSYNTWDSKDSWYYGIIIDGKDASEGPHVYDWDHQFFESVWKGLNYIYKDEGTPNGTAPLSMYVIRKLRGRCCSAWDFEKPGSTHKSGRDIHPMCSNMMSCEERVALLDGMWDELYQHDGDKNCPTNLVILRKDIKATKQELTIKLVKDYNQAIADANHDEDKWTALAKFSRTWMWIHPMKSGNGRLHSLILQREVRRLGLGCGLMMYNQNKDAFVDTQDMMKSKLKEGLEMFKKSAASGKNEWLQKENVDLHFATQKLPESLKQCEAKKSFGSGGNLQFPKSYSKP